MDDFSQHPMTIGELKAERDENRGASIWSPRDALIALLREIDSGEIKPDALVILMRIETEDGRGKASYRAASPDLLTTLGLVGRGMFMINLDATPSVIRDAGA